MSFTRRAFFYLLLISAFAPACATVKPVPPPPTVGVGKDYLPAGPMAGAYYHFLLGQLYLQSGSTDQAASEYRQALEKDKTSALLHTHLAALYLKKGLPDKALQEAEEAIRSDPKSLPALLLLGGLYVSLNQREKAIQAYQTAVQIQPKARRPISSWELSTPRPKIMIKPSPISRPW